MTASTTLWICALSVFIQSGSSESSARSLARAHGLLYVEVGLADESSVLALLDTGASASAIDPRRSSELAVLELSEVLGTTGSMPVEMVELEGARLGEQVLPKLRATRRDLSGLLSPDERPVEMILGSDAFIGRALTIDFAASTLRLAKSEEGFGEPMMLDHGIPAIEAELGGLPLWLRIDTGASLFASPDVYVNVPTKLWDALRRADATLAPTSSLQGTGADGESVDLPVVPLPDALIGPRPFERIFLIVQPEVGYFALPEAKGFVSNNYLEKLGRVTFDYGAERFRHDASPAAAEEQKR
jgi:hypothetical protein